MRSFVQSVNFDEHASWLYINAVRDGLYRKHRENKEKDPYGEASLLMESKIFENSTLANVLGKDIHDESHSLIVEEVLSSIDHTNSKRHLLHLFSGSGRLLWDLAKLRSPLHTHFKIFNVDLSKQMLCHIRENFQMVKDIFNIQANVSHIPFLDNSVDIIICHGSLRYIPPTKHSDVLAEILRVANAHCKIVISEGIYRIIEDIVRTLQQIGLSPTVKEKFVRRFRCSTFYILYRHYHQDALFQSHIDSLASINSTTCLRILTEMAGYTYDNMYTVCIKK